MIFIVIGIPISAQCHFPFYVYCFILLLQKLILDGFTDKLAVFSSESCKVEMEQEFKRHGIAQAQMMGKTNILALVGNKNRGPAFRSHQVSVLRHPPPPIDDR